MIEKLNDMHQNPTIHLRPRFKKTLFLNKTEALHAFKSATLKQHPFIVNCVDNHVFIKIEKSQRHLWTPHLHLEFLEIDSNRCYLKGLFGPNPRLWTMFMFLHFIIGMLFLGFSVWTYSNHRLGQDFIIPFFLMLLMVIAWFVLYALGRYGRAQGRSDMERLYEFMESVLNL